jgi:hypothetical protein
MTLRQSALQDIHSPDEKMLKVLVPVSIGLLNDDGTICFEMDPPGVRDDQDPS